MSSSCCFVSSLSLIPFKLTLFSSVHCPSKSLIMQPLKPLKISSLHRTIITFQKFPTRFVPLPSASSSSCPSSSVDPQPIEELPPNLQEIVKLFQSEQEPGIKHHQVILYGKNLKPLDSQFKTSENKVEGCISQVWIRAFFDEQRNIVYEADSDAVYTKGLAYILVQGLSGRPVPEILRIKPDFGVLLGLSVSPSRNNGFLNMLKLMQKKALHLKDSSSGESSESSFVSTLESEVEASVPEVNLVEDSGAEKIEDSQSGSNGVSLGSRGMRIREKLEKELNPLELEVEDVSYRHAGVKDIGDDEETHFNLRIVSYAFQGKSFIKRHKLIYDLLQEELQSGLHALSIVAKTPVEA